MFYNEGETKKAAINNAKHSGEKGVYANLVLETNSMTKAFFCNLIWILRVSKWNITFSTYFWNTIKNDIYTNQKIWRNTMVFMFAYLPILWLSQDNMYFSRVFHRNGYLFVLSVILFDSHRLSSSSWSDSGEEWIQRCPSVYLIVFFMDLFVFPFYKEVDLLVASL